MVDLALLRDDLVRDEGMVLHPYRDTAGKWTIGVGRNLTDNGINENEALFLLDNDIARTVRELDRQIPWWRSLPESAMRGLANMHFNMGWPRLSRFTKMLAALRNDEWDVAAAEALNSRWARQVHSRAERIAAQFRAGWNNQIAES